MEPTPDGGEPGAEFILPKRDVVHPENWKEWEAKGFKWYRNHRLNEGETAFTTSGQPSLSFMELSVGKENVVTGDPFDSKEGRPVQRPGELGIYWRPSESQ